MEALNDIVAQQLPVKFLTVCSDEVRRLFDGQTRPSVNYVFEQFPHIKGLQGNYFIALIFR